MSNILQAPALTDTVSYPLLQTPDLRNLSEEELQYYANIIKNRHHFLQGIDREAFASDCMNNIWGLLATEEDLERNINRILILAQMYGFAKTSIYFPAEFMGYRHHYENEDIRGYIMKFLLQEQHEHSINNIGPMISYIYLYADRVAIQKRQETQQNQKEA